MAFDTHPVGTILGGKYRIEGVIAVGGMGTVYRVTHRNQGEFAVKILSRELATFPDMRARFLREGYAANSVRHRGVVAVVDDDIAEDGSVFLVMELLHGMDVDCLRALHGGQLPVPVALAIIDELLDVLAAAHAKGIIHRDIKPANLFLTTEGTVKVLDFGIARARRVANLGGEAETCTGVLLGTPAFMSPEQARGASAAIDAQTDLWSVGATLFTLLTGENVHVSDSVSGLVLLSGMEKARPLASALPSAAEAVAHVVDRALAFEKSDRWESATAMRRALRDAAERAGLKLASRSTLVGAVRVGGGGDGPDSADERAVESDGGAAWTELAGRRSRSSTARDTRPARRARLGVLVTAGLALCAIVASGIVHRRAQVPAPGVSSGASLDVRVTAAAPPAPLPPSASPPSLLAADLVRAAHLDEPPASARPPAAAPAPPPLPAPEPRAASIRAPSPPSALAVVVPDGGAARTADPARSRPRRPIDEEDPYGAPP